jgi:putative endonuclease
MRTIELGRAGEDVAAAYLRSRGMTVVDRNWRCPAGEIDLVAVDGPWLVVCEVKTRRSLVAGEPVEAVTPDKVRRLRRLALAWVEAHSGGPRRAVRIDVVSVWWPPNGPVVVRHVKSVG